MANTLVHRKTWSSLHRLAGIHCSILLSYGIHDQVGTREVHRSSQMWLMSSAQDYFISLALLIISMTVVSETRTDLLELEVMFNT